MNKEAAVTYMVGKIEEIERSAIAEAFSSDPKKTKKEVVSAILKAIKEVQIDSENQQNKM